MAYLNQLRNNLDIGYKKSSVYNKSSYEEGYKSPQYAIKTKTGKPEDHRLFSESVHTVSSSVH